MPLASFRTLGELAHDHRRRQRAQGAEADALDRGAHVGDVVSAAVVGGRVGDGDGTRRQQRLGLHQARGFVAVAVGIRERALQLERRGHVRGEAEFTACGLCGDAFEGVGSVHWKIIPPINSAACEEISRFRVR
jgi:hypothetical protein